MKRENQLRTELQDVKEQALLVENRLGVELRGREKEVEEGKEQLALRSQELDLVRAHLQEVKEQAVKRENQLKAELLDWEKEVKEVREKVSLEGQNKERPDKQITDGEVSERIARVCGELELVRLHLQHVRQQAEVPAKVRVERQSRERREPGVTEQLARVVEDVGRLEKLGLQKKVYGGMIQKEGSKLDGEKGMGSRRWGKVRRRQEKRQGRRYVSGGRMVRRGRDDSLYEQEEVESSRNEGRVLSGSQPGGKTERKETRNKHRFQSTAGAVAFGTKVKVRSIRVMVVVWCLWWIKEVMRPWAELGVMRAVLRGGLGWYSSSHRRECRGGEIEVVQGKRRQVSPRFGQSGARWCWDPGASASVIWMHAGLLVRAMWIRRGRGVKEKGRTLRVLNGCQRLIGLSSWICDSWCGSRDQPGL